MEFIIVVIIVGVIIKNILESIKQSKNQNQNQNNGNADAQSKPVKKQSILEQLTEAFEDELGIPKPASNSTQMPRRARESVLANEQSAKVEPSPAMSVPLEGLRGITQSKINIMSSSMRDARYGDIISTEGECDHEEYSHSNGVDTQMDINEVSNVFSNVKMNAKNDTAYHSTKLNEITEIAYEYKDVYQASSSRQYALENAATILKAVGLKNAVIAAEILKRPKPGVIPFKR